jgi:Arc/MetJ-type ribon-helix-helix transcriptional regulator
MPRTKIAITVERETLAHLDRLVKNQVFPNRSQAIQAALEEKLARLEKHRLARECAKLDPADEKAFAEEGIKEEFSQWPKY